MATKKRIKIIGSVILGIFILMATTSWFVLSALMSESLHTHRGSFNYFVTIHSSLIKNAPVIQPKLDPEFHYAAGFDDQQSSNAITYISLASPDDIALEMRAYILKNDYQPVSDATGTGGETYEKNDNRADFFILSKGDETIVHLEEKFASHF